MPDAEVIFRSDVEQPLGVRYLYDVSFAFAGNAPSGSGAEFHDDISGSFSKITGLREEVESVTWRDGTEPFRVNKGPGTIAGGVATFEKGIVRAPLLLLRWFTAVRFLSKQMQFELVRNQKKKVNVKDVISPILIDGMVEGTGLNSGAQQIPIGDEFGFFANISITIGSCEPQIGDGRVGDGSWFGARRVALFKCWPVAYQIADLDAQSSEIAIESLSVAFDELRTGRATEGPDRRVQSR